MLLYTPKAAQNSLNSMIQFKYDHDYDPDKILTFSFTDELCLI
jgi:hypothetical protein